MWDVIDADTGIELFWSTSQEEALLFQRVNVSIKTILIFV